MTISRQARWPPGAWWVDEGIHGLMTQKDESLEICVLDGGKSGRRKSAGDREVRRQNVCLELWEFSRQWTDGGGGGGVVC